MTVERADWLFSNHMVESRDGSLAGQQTSRHEQVNKLARHHDGLAGKPVQDGEWITTVDGITEDGLCLLFGRILSGRFGSGIRSQGGNRSEDSVRGGSVWGGC